MIFVTSVLRYNFLSDFDRTVEHVDFSLIHVHSTVQPQFHTVLAQSSLSFTLCWPRPQESLVTAPQHGLNSTGCTKSQSDKIFTNYIFQRELL